MRKPQRVRDPLHNLVEFSGGEFEQVLWQVLQTPEFQRLRRIKQLGFSELVYPGASHSRFIHSVGVFHTARLLMDIIKRHLGSNGFSDQKSITALAAALVHDLGHGPFSHAFEDVGKRLNLKMANHELVSDLLIRQSSVSEVFRQLGSGFADDVADVIKSSGPGNIYSAVVSSQFDADRLDYMRRDRLMSGTQHGGIDFEWLMANLEIGSVAFGVDDDAVGSFETFVLGSKAVFAAESYVIGLFQLYPTVYFHKTTQAAEKIFSELIIRLISLCRDGHLDKTGLSVNNPIAIFASNPEEISAVLKLDDSVMWGSLPLMFDAKDSLVSTFAKRLRDRNLYKAIDIRSRVGQLLSEKGADITSMNRICVSIDQKIQHWSKEQKDEIPRVLTDRAIREPYKRFQESKGPLNQIRVRTNSGELVDLGERSSVVAAIEPFQFDRVYYAGEDLAARQYIENTIQQEVINAKRD